jgi:hypothetical protein
MTAGRGRSGRRRAARSCTAPEIRLAVRYTATGDSFSPEKPRVLATTPGAAPGFDIAPDGRLLMMMPTIADGSKTDHTLMFVQNFYDELRRRVPVGK